MVSADQSEYYPGSKGRRGYYQDVVRITPEIEYYRDTDTITYDEGKRTLMIYLTFDDSYMFSVGESLRIVELKTDTDKRRPLTFFHYWLHTYELIVILLVSFIIFGVYQYFKT